MRSLRDQIGELSIEEIGDYAPSALATEPMPGASGKYSFVSTIDAVELVKSQGWVPYYAKECSVRVRGKNGFQHHIIRFTRGEMVGALGEERFDLILNNSHDRGSAFKLSLGIFRLVCTNGMVVGQESYNFSHKHINFDEAAFIGSVRQIADDGHKIADRVDDFKQIELTRQETGIYAASAAALISEDPNEIDLNEVVKTRRADDAGADLWRTFNRAQENIIRGGIRRYGKTKSGRPKRDTMPVKSIDRDIKLNKALWLLTEKMAEIKGASPAATGL